MKLIQVNPTRTLNDRRRNRSIEMVFKQTILFLKSKRLRNKRLLSEKSEVTLVYLSVADMKKINFSFRGKKKATDILSFVSSDPRSLGELLICLDVLKRQARDQNHSLFAETSYMMIHGVLHLLGYDHEKSKQEAKLMFRIQDECFKSLQVL